MHVHERCGRCGSHELLSVPVTPGDHSHIVLGEALLRCVAVAKYVCTDCGYIEQWVNSKDDLAKLKVELAHNRRQGPLPSVG
jgi:hypothetical protein